ncbi:hypothetical protein TrCOL_g9564 [Triparma columacea]|uniref:ABC transporter domain-containing protein n=1 Tax=Triparma columacea TaxID=722753 RepID=A0A9W7GJE3_9STRA|nr:hypothetical protein TrCOL_g9564 [Triparma columacea]
MGSFRSTSPTRESNIPSSGSGQSLLETKLLVQNPSKMRRTNKHSDLHGRSKTYKISMLLMVLCLLMSLFSLIMNSFYCNALHSNTQDDNSCSDAWLWKVFPTFLVLSCCFAISICGCGMGLGESSWRFCMRDETFKKVNSLLVVIFGSCVAIFIWPLLMSYKLGDAVSSLFFFSVMVFISSWCCLSCCTKTESEYDEDEEAEKRKALHKKTVWSGIKMIPFIFVVIAGTEVLRIRIWVYHNMTGIDYILSPEGYYWTLNTANKGIDLWEVFEMDMEGEFDRRDVFDDEDRRILRGTSVFAPGSRIWMNDEDFDPAPEDCALPLPRNLEDSDDTPSPTPTPDDDSYDDPYDDEDDDFENWNTTDFVDFLDEWVENNPISIDNKQFAIWHCEGNQMKNFVTGVTDAEQCNPFAVSSDDFHMTGCPSGVFKNFTEADDSDAAYYQPHTSACPAGFFCPENYQCIIACIEGASCLPTVPETDGNQCVPDSALGTTKKPLNKVLIEDGGFVCPGSRQGTLCPKGKYCPTTFETPVICPKGKYCPRGSFEPQDCRTAFSRCNYEGMDRPSYVASIKTVTILVILLLLAVAQHATRRFFLSRSRKQEMKVANMYRKKEVGVDLLPHLDEKGPLRMDIEFDNLGLILNGTKKRVLNSVTGLLRAGRITAIMGPSGAGKTTFMNVLAGKASYGETTGNIRINGSEDRVMNYSSLCGFVPQDDTMMRDLTVEENLLFYARMRLPASTSNNKCKLIVADVIKTLGISHVKHEPIGDETVRGISGGQRKRVNVGMEMVSNPSLLFLDEPTSGLDSATSYELLEALKEIAKKGTNVIVVLHQPSYQLFELFDDVLLLGKGGSTVYLGPSGECNQYFKTLGFDCPDRVNPADFFMDVIAGKHPRKNDDEFEPSKLFQLWKDVQSEVHTGSPDTTIKTRISAAALESVKPMGFLRSFFMYMGRAILQYNKHKVTFISDIAMQVVAGAVVGSLYREFQFKQLTMMNFMLGLIVGLTTSLAELRVFGGEREVFWRESSPGSGMNLDTLSYFLAKTMVELGRIAILVTAILVSFYPLASPRCEFSLYWNICFAAALMATGVPIIFSTSMDPKSAQLATVVFILIANMMSGNQPTLSAIDKMGTGAIYLSRLSYARWFDEALFIAETAHYADAWKMPPNFLKTSDSVVARLVKFSYTEGMADLNIYVMYYLAIIFRIVAYIGLVSFNRDKRSLPSFFDLVVEDIFTPLKELMIDLTMVNGPAAANGFGKSVRKGLGVTAEEEAQFERRSQMNLLDLETSEGSGENGIEQTAMRISTHAENDSTRAENDSTRA